MSEVAEAKPTSLDLVVQEFNLGTLTTNARAIMDAVKVKLEGYKAENYSEDNIGRAKQDKAELNAAAKQLNDKRLEYERKFMEPLSEFKDLVTHTCALIKTASSQIDTVVKEVDEREKVAKWDKIEAFFLAQKCELFALDRIFSQSWLNKTTKLKDIEAEITARIKKANEDLVILDKISEPEAKAHYLITLDLQSAIKKADEIKSNREKLAAIQKAKEEEDARKEAEAKERLAAQEAKQPEPEAVPVPVSEAIAAIPEPEPVKIETPTVQEATPVAKADSKLSFSLRVSGSHAQLQALRKYMDFNGIVYEKL